jgi:hypothetical protein
LARGVIINRLREVRDGRVDSMEDVYPSYENVARALLKEMEMDSSRTTSRGLVKGIISLASFKAFFIRSGFSEEDMRNCIKILTEVDCGGNVWKSSVLAVLGEGGGGEFGPFLLTEAVTRVGSLRFSPYVVKGVDDDSLGTMAEDLRELHSRLCGAERGAGDASYEVVYKCLLTYATNVRAWNKAMLDDAGAVGERVCADVGETLPCIAGLLPRASKGERQTESEVGEERSVADADSPVPEWLSRLQRKAGVGGAEDGEIGRGEPDGGLAMVTPIYDRSASVRNLTVATGGLLTEFEAAPAAAAKEESATGGSKRLVIYDGKETGFVREEKGSGLAVGLLNANWEECWISKEKRVPAENSRSIFNFRNDGHVELHGEGVTLEALVDELLATNKLEILDKIRDLRGEAGLPPPAPPISPSSAMKKKERRGSQLLAALRGLSPKPKGGKAGAIGAGAVEAILKLGTDMNMDDGVTIQSTPVLTAMKAELGNVETLIR